MDLSTTITVTAAALPIVGGIGAAVIRYYIFSPINKRIDETKAALDIHLVEDKTIHAAQQDSLERIQAGVDRLTYHLIDKSS